MMNINNATINISVKHIFCKYEDMPAELIEKAGRGKMKGDILGYTSYMVYKFEDFVIFPD